MFATTWLDERHCIFSISNSHKTSITFVNVGLTTHQSMTHMVMPSYT